MPRKQVDEYLVYTFDELEEAVQEKVLQEWAQQNSEMLDPDDIQLEFTHVLEERGLPTRQIEFNLSWSQGDGVAFYGSMHKEDTEKIMRFYNATSLFPLCRKYGVTASISKNSFGHHYAHWNTMTVSVDAYDWPENYIGQDIPDHPDFVLLEKELPEFEEWLTEKVQETSHQLERMGYDHIDWVCSKEYIMDQIEMNNVEFREDGRVA